MQDRAEPYFMTNKEWYRISLDSDGLPGDRGLVLTDKAPKEAIESYEEYYKEVDELSILQGLL